MPKPYTYTVLTQIAYLFLDSLPWFSHFSFSVYCFIVLFLTDSGLENELLSDSLTLPNLSTTPPPPPPFRLQICMPAPSLSVSLLWYV